MSYPPRLSCCPRTFVQKYFTPVFLRKKDLISLCFYGIIAKDFKSGFYFTDYTCLRPAAETVQSIHPAP